MGILRRLSRRSDPRRAADTPAFPRTLDEALARFPPLYVPAKMRDPATDVGLQRYADKLVSLTWGHWQVIHERAEIRKEVRQGLLPALIAALGEPEAMAAASVANRAGTAVNSLVIGYFTTSALAAYTVDQRLAKTWLNLTDNHEANATPGRSSTVHGACSSGPCGRVPPARRAGSRSRGTCPSSNSVFGRTKSLPGSNLRADRQAQPGGDMPAEHV
jgi:hypothetical protein